MKSQNHSGSTFELPTPPKNIPTLFEALTARQPKLSPPVPDEVAHFRSMRQNRKIAHDKMEKIANTVHMTHKDFFDQKWEAELYNHNSFIMLYALLQDSKEDPAKQHAIKVKLDIFRKTIEATQHPYTALRICFKKFPYESIYQHAINELNQPQQQTHWED